MSVLEGVSLAGWEMLECWEGKMLAGRIGKMLTDWDEVDFS